MHHLSVSATAWSQQNMLQFFTNRYLNDLIPIRVIGGFDADMQIEVGQRRHPIETIVIRLLLGLFVIPFGTTIAALCFFLHVALIGKSGGLAVIFLLPLALPNLCVISIIFGFPAAAPLTCVVLPLVRSFQPDMRGPVVVSLAAIGLTYGFGVMYGIIPVMSGRPDSIPRDFGVAVAGAFCGALYGLWTTNRSS